MVECSDTAKTTETINSQSPLISVIIPVYNVEKYLRECIDSVLSQIYKNLEIILVDDGSPDNCPQICDEYAEKDSRIKVIHKENGGLSSARNAGISSATGQYAMMVDGDDWIDKETLSEMQQKAAEHDADCVMACYVKEYDNFSVPVNVFSEDVYTATNDASMLFYHRLFGELGQELSHPELADSLCTCWTKLYKREVALKGRYFDTKVVGSYEDGLFNIYALHGAERLYYINKPFYHYRKTNTGSLTTVYKKDMPKLWKNMFSEIQKALFELNCPKLCYDAFSNKIALSIVGIGFNELNNLNKKEIKRNIKAYISTEQYQKTIKKLQFKYLPLKWKVFLWFCKKKNVGMVCWFLRVMNKLKRKGRT